MLILFLSFLGVLDSAYLTWEHFNSSGSVLCFGGFFSACGRVLNSPYSQILGVPVAAIGLFHYTLLFVFLNLFFYSKKRFWKYLAAWEGLVGAVASLYFVFLMAFVIRAACIYCLGSALISFLIFYFYRKNILVYLSHAVYVYILKPFLFRFTKADEIHESMINMGEFFGKYRFIRDVFSFFYKYKDGALEQNILGISFDNPIGLAAGFDYEGRLQQFLPSLGLGFGTLGTVTNMVYEGNPPPMLGRLPKSRSLLVNKGFKSSGAKSIGTKLSGKKFKYPVGISVGRTNSEKLGNQMQSVSDIVSAFRTLDKMNLDNSYWELNISCPNLIHAGNVEFYSLGNLEKLLIAVDKLKLKKPVFVKMPIDKSDKEVLGMLKIISKHCPKGIIFGNLQKDRENKAFERSEIERAGMGNFSGKPTFERSNELIALAYKNFKDRFVIIGCGGVFCAGDAYKKIKLGASLVQMITGLIFEGPQVCSMINMELVQMLDQDGYKNVSDAVGHDVV